MLHWILIAAQLVASGLDARLTYRNVIERHGQEQDALFQPFVHNGSQLAAAFAADAAVKIGAGELLREFGHPRIAAAVALAGITDSTFGIAYSAAHSRTRKGP